MEYVQFSALILMGSSERFLQEFMRTASCGKFVLHFKSLTNGLKKVGFQVSLSSGAYFLLNLEFEKAEKEPAERPLSEVINLDNATQNYSGLHEVIHAEASSKGVYVVSKKRMDVEKLLSSVGDLFARDAFQKLPPLCQYDFTEAGRCVAFERATAAAFHILRAIEGLLRAYYCKQVKRGRLKNEGQMWGALIDALRKKRGKKTELLNDLQIIKDYFRNPTQHPDKCYDMDEVQDLFARCIDVANRMVKEF